MEWLGLGDDGISDVDGLGDELGTGTTDVDGLGDALSWAKARHTRAASTAKKSLRIIIIIVVVARCVA